jgi:hypothetical protein
VQRSTENEARQLLCAGRAKSGAFIPSPFQTVGKMLRPQLGLAVLGAV